MQILILAAGKGTRMNQDVPKCAVMLDNKPMINYLLETVENLSDNIYVVVGYQKEKLKEIISKKVTYIEQTPLKGTGHALLQSLPHIVKDTPLLIIPGDMPLIKEEVLKELLMCHQMNQNDLTLLATTKDNPTGYGRIVSDEIGRIIKIVEEQDATKEEKQIKKVNMGIYIINYKVLKDNIYKLKNNNKQQEYYLTDLIDIIHKECHIGVLEVEDNYRLTGINDLQTLKEVEKGLQNDRIT